MQQQPSPEAAAKDEGLEEKKAEGVVSASKTSATEGVASADDDSDSTSSEESEDDPEKDAHEA